MVDQDEQSMLAVYDEEADEAVTGSAYGGRKVLCEQVADVNRPPPNGAGPTGLWAQPPPMAPAIALATVLLSNL